jgi:hypothetical protein
MHWSLTSLECIHLPGILLPRPKKSKLHAENCHTFLRLTASRLSPHPRRTLSHTQIRGLVQDCSFPHIQKWRLSIGDINSNAIQNIQIPRQLPCHVQKQYHTLCIIQIGGVMQRIVIKHNTFTFVPVIIGALGEHIFAFNQMYALIFLNVVADA